MPVASASATTSREPFSEARWPPWPASAQLGLLALQHTIVEPVHEQWSVQHPMPWNSGHADD
eukprot:9063668-Prorocentrum_lima.AAC.1